MEIQVRSASGRQLINLPSDATILDLKGALQKLEGFQKIITMSTPLRIADHNESKYDDCKDSRCEGEEKGEGKESDGGLKFLRNGGWVVDLMQFASKRIQTKDMTIVVRPDIF
jgi:hypothetical protein